MLGLNGLLWAALLVSYLAPYTDPVKCWPIAFFGLAYPVLFTVNAILLVYWLFRKKLFALVSVIIVICGWGVMNNNIGFNTSSASYAPGLNVIKLMTYNVHNFKRYGANNDISTKHEILELINEQQPDIIGIQEFYTRYRGQYDMRDSIFKIMGTEYYYLLPSTANGNEAIGIAIFSKYPVIARGIVAFSGKIHENSCIYVDVQKGNQIFRVYSVHLQSIRFDPEDYKYLNEVAKEGKPDVASARRLGSKLKIAFEKRSVQVKNVKESAAHCPYPYIIMGDFNDTPSSFAVNTMAKGMRNAFRERGFGFGRTYNGDFPNYQIDYIMATRQFDIANYHIIEEKLSDHYPVRSDVILK